MSLITHTFIIGDENKEPERVQYLKKFFDGKPKVTYFQPTYKDTVTQEELDKYVKDKTTEYNRPLKLSEISLFLNFMYLFEKILNEYIEGNFLILESDVIFLAGYEGYTKYLNDILPKMIELGIDGSSIGRGSNRDPPGINPNHIGYQFIKITGTRCTDSLIFSYNGIKKIYSHIQSVLNSGKSINQPIDNFLDSYFSYNKDFKFIWIYPSICIQGSQNGSYRTSIQGP